MGKLRDRMAISTEPPKLSDRYYQAIGQITVGFSQLQLVIGTYTTFLLGVGWDIGKIVVSELDFSELLDLHFSLFIQQNKSEEARNELKQSIQKARKLMVERNKIVHSVWIISETGNATRTHTRATGHRGLKVESKPYPIEQLTQIYSEINHLMVALVIFYRKRLKAAPSATAD